MPNNTFKIPNIFHALTRLIGADGETEMAVANPLQVNNVDLYAVTGTSTLKTLAVSTAASSLGLASTGLYGGTVLPSATCLVMFYSPTEIWMTYDGTTPVVGTAGFPRSGIWYESLKGGSTELDKIKIVAANYTAVQCQPMMY